MVSDLIKKKGKKLNACTLRSAKEQVFTQRKMKKKNKKTEKEQFNRPHELFA